MCSGFRKIRQTMEGLVFVAREFFVNGLWQLAKCSGEGDQSRYNATDT